MSRKFKILLSVSLVLNVLLLGMMGGMLYKKHQWRQYRSVAVASDLSPEARNIVARNFQAAQRDMKNSFRRSKKARNDVIKLLKKDEVDEKRYERAIEALKKTQGDMIERKMEMLYQLSRELPPEERKKISEHFIRPHGPHKGRGDEKRKPDYND